MRIWRILKAVKIKEAGMKGKKLEKGNKNERENFSKSGSRP